MKLISTIAIVATALAPTFVQAGGLAPTIEETEIIIPAKPQSSASDYVVPLIFLALAIAAANSDAAGGSVSGGESVSETDLSPR